MSAWYGISKSGTFGSPNFSISTFSLSSLPIGTLLSIMFGIVSMIFLILTSSSSCSFSISAILSLFFLTVSLILFASSTFFSRISMPIWLLKVFLLARKVSASCFKARFCLSSSSTSSTSGSFSSWNFFLIFSLTSSLFVLIKFMSIIFFSPFLLKYSSKRR